MQIRIVNIAQKLPAWVDAACDDYLRRMPREITPEIVTVPLASRRARQSAQRQQARENELMLGKLAPGSLNLALDEGGETWSSRDWSRQLDRWMLEYPRVNFLIGGPDGLSAECLAACSKRISLGRMTLPHALVKVVLLEQLYRAWSILQGHPYHRE